MDKYVELLSVGLLLVITVSILVLIVQLSQTRHMVIEAATQAKDSATKETGELVGEKREREAEALRQTARR